MTSNIDRSIEASARLYAAADKLDPFAYSLTMADGTVYSVTTYTNRVRP